MAPDGWVLATLDELGELFCGQSVPSSAVNALGKGTIYITGPEQWDGKHLHQNKWTERPARIAPAGCIFITVKGSGVGKTFPGIAAAIGRDVYAYKPDENVDRGFVHRAIDHRISEIIEDARGVIPGLSRDHIVGHELSLPPEAEQRRIVASLDALAARLARARAELDRVPVLAERLRTATLRQAFHWETDDLPIGWIRQRVDQVGLVQLGRQRSPKDHHGSHMRPYVRSANVTWGGWDLTDVKEMNFSPEEFPAFVLEKGDVLLNEGSGSAKEVGKPAVWNGEIEGACFQNTLLRVRPINYLPDLLRYALLYMAKSGKFVANTKGVNIIHIGKAGLAKIIIPVPPVEQQSAILVAINTAFARADRLEAEAARARKLIDRLESAILAKAFRGELVPQDPDDEPASVLLERIRAERAVAPKPKRGRGAKEAAGA